MKGYSITSQLHSVPACQAIVKKSRCQAAGPAYGCETLPETGSRYRIQFAIIKDTAPLYLDTSGEGLYKRGYRAQNKGAPAGDAGRRPGAALPLPGLDPFCDPFCGSGTIPIEAALIAKNRAPGLDRRFAAQSGRTSRQAVAGRAEEAMDKNSTASTTSGAGHRPRRGGAGRHNAALAGWTTACASRWRMPESSTGTATTASW